MIGQVLGNYRITGVLGQGGMGIVYEGEHALIRRKVAIKVLLPERSQNQEIVQRFFNEARASTLIRHPGIVDIFDFGYHASGSAYIVMEFLEGESLSRHLGRTRQLFPEWALPILRQLATTLGAAHRKGIVHRDLKPDNCFLVSCNRNGGRTIPSRPLNRQGRSYPNPFRVNRRIRAKEVRVIADDGTQLGVMPTYEALGIAEEKRLDLVEVSRTEIPPVCRIMDYGRFSFEEAKKRRLKGR